jgi:predicted TIM-barrel fold metal-dependent hydrolase
MNTPIPRRRFLKTTAIATAAGVLPVFETACKRQKAISKDSNLVDTHLHCFAGPDDPRFPYHPRGPYQPEAAATPEHLLKCMDEGGIVNAIVVHPEPYQDDHRYLEYCLEVGEGRLKGTGLFFADRPGSLEKVTGIAKRLPLIALRVHAYAPDRLPPFGKPELRKLWQTAGDHGLAVQIHMEPRYAPGFEPLIKEFSDIRVIIDHLGRPFQGTPEEHETVVRWSQLPNTIIKMAAIPAQDKFPHRDIRPIIKRLVAEYGADRMIYGGGFNADATGASYKNAFEKGRSYISHLTADQQALVLGGNAMKLFGF